MEIKPFEARAGIYRFKLNITKTYVLSESKEEAQTSLLGNAKKNRYEFIKFQHKQIIFVMKIEYVTIETGFWAMQHVLTESQCGWILTQNIEDIYERLNTDAT